MKREHYDLGNPVYPFMELEDSIETYKEIIEEFSKYYLKHVGSNDEVASGYLLSIEILKEDISQCERIIGYYDGIYKNSEQLATRNREASFNPW